jgi:integrase
MGIMKIGSVFYADWYEGTGEGRRRRRRAVGPKRADAVAFLGKLQAAKREGRLFDMKREEHTFAELLERYNETVKGQKSYKDKKSHLVILKSYFSGRLLTDITTYDLEHFRNQRRATPIKTRTQTRERSLANVNRVLSTLRHMFSKAVEWNLIEQSPFSRCKHLFYKEDNVRVRYLTEEEESRLLRNCTGHLKPIVLCALNTGMRKGEILTLKWENIRNGFIYLNKTKTGETRQIPINKTLTSLFQSLPRHITSEYVFCSKEGKPYVDIKKSFKSALKRTGIQDFRFHDLRHSFASKLVSKGAPLKALQELLGHKNIKMTMRYAHLADSVKKDVVRLLDGVNSKDESTRKVDKKKD